MATVAYKAVVVPSPFDKEPVLQYDRFVQMGVHPDTLKRLGQYNLATAVAQYYGNVQQGLVVADLVHLYRGLERELMHGQNEDGDKDVYVFSWKPAWEWEWDSRAQKPRNLAAPQDRVFVVQARLFEPDRGDGLIGEVLHWTWITEDAAVKAAPEGWERRYAEHVWTKYK